MHGVAELAVAIAVGAPHADGDDLDHALVVHFELQRAFPARVGPHLPPGLRRLAEFLFVEVVRLVERVLAGPQPRERHLVDVPGTVWVLRGPCAWQRTRQESCRQRASAQPGFRPAALQSSPRLPTTSRSVRPAEPARWRAPSPSAWRCSPASFRDTRAGSPAAACAPETPLRPGAAAQPRGCRLKRAAPRGR